MQGRPCSRSYSGSQIRLPSDASSAEGRTPLRWSAAWRAQITAHLTLPIASHQRSRSGSGRGRRRPRRRRGTARARRARRPAARRCRSARSGCKASRCPRPGPPQWQSSQSITAASPSLVDDQVAEPEVAVHEALRRPVAARSAAAIAGRPRPPEAARRSRRAAPPTARRPPAPGRRRRAGTPSIAARVDRVDRSQRLAELARQAPRGHRPARRGAGPEGRPRCPRRTPSAARRSPAGRREARRPAASATGTPALGRGPEHAVLELQRVERLAGTGRVAAHHPPAPPPSATTYDWREAPPGSAVSVSSPGIRPDGLSDQIPNAVVRKLGHKPNPRCQHGPGRAKTEAG